MDRLAIFSYMVGQWDVGTGQHNISIIVPPDYSATGLGVAIPYDFRSYRPGKCKLWTPWSCHGTLIKTATGNLQGSAGAKKTLPGSWKFRDLKGSFYSVINDFPYLDQDLKKILQFSLISSSVNSITRRILTGWSHNSWVHGKPLER